MDQDKLTAHQRLWKPLIRVFPRGLACSATCWCLLVTPLLVFLKFYGYPLATPEIVLCSGILGLIAFAFGLLTARWEPGRVAVYAGLLTLLLDIQVDALAHVWQFVTVFAGAAVVLWLIREHATVTVGAVSATMLLTTLVVPSTPYRPRDSRQARETNTTAHPFILHVLLDEHVGVDGFPLQTEPQQFATELRQFFKDRGFLLFSQAYSEYFVTHMSLSHLLNYASRDFDKQLYGRGDGDFEYSLRRNAHFNGLSEKGYRISVYQSNHINHCTPDVDCTTYNFSNISAVAGTSLKAHSKAWVIGSVYISRTTLYTRLRDHYESGRDRLNQWVDLPRWRAKANNIGPIIAMDAFELLTQRVAQATRGEYVYAHLLLPHSPYAFDAQCNLRQPSDWLQRYISSVDNTPVNTPESRALRYDRYIGQLRCVYSKLAAVLDAIPKDIAGDAVVVVHGDHGSRITILEPKTTTVEQMAVTDFIDSYSTLFAVRGPGFERGEIREPVSITCAFASLAAIDFTSVGDIDSCPHPEILVTGGAGRPARWVPMPPFVMPEPQTSPTPGANGG